MFWKIVGLGVLTVLAFDTAASFASISFGFPYGNAAVGSVFIYVTVGYLVFRHRGFFSAVGAALLVQAVDATLGWYISWQIGPGALPAEQISTAVIATTIVFSLIFAAVCAAIGSTIARAVHGPRTNAYVSRNDSVMSRTKKIIAAMSLLITVTAMAGALWWWKNGDDLLVGFRRQGQENIKAGHEYGLSSTSIGCVQVAAARGGQCESGDLLCELKVRAFLNGCLPVTREFPQFCSSLPSYEDRVARLTWAVRVCTEQHLTNERCARIVNEAAVLCAKREASSASEHT